AVLVLAAEDDPQSAWKRVEGLQGRVDIRGLRIVVVADAVYFADEFQPMLHRAERANSGRDLLERCARKPGGSRCCHDVLDVVPPPERNVARFEKWLFIETDQAIRFKPQPRLDRPREAEPDGR